MTSITRRQALVLLAGAGGAVGAGLVVLRVDGDGGDDDGGDDSGRSTPVAESAALDGVARIGARYLELHPEEASAEALTNAIGGPAGSDPFRAVQRRLRDELADGDVVVVDGWVLSRTEARLCALVALDALDA